MQTVPWIGGIAHPTGFPAFVALGWLFSHVVLVGPVAWRLALFSSVATVVAALALYAIAVELTAKPVVACAGALLFLTTEVVWERATRAEVHALALAFATTAFALAFRYVRTGRPRALVLAAVAAGLALATHPVAVWSLPGLVALALRRRPSRAVAIACVAMGAACAIVPYALLPLWSAVVAARRLDPTLTIGFSPGMPFFDYAHVAAPRNFWWFVTGQQFEKADGLRAYVEPWRFLGFAGSLARLESHEWTPLGVAFGLGGLLAIVRRSRTEAVAIALFGFAAVPFALAYTLEADKARYLLIALWTSALLVAVGVASLAELFARRGRRATTIATALASGALVLWATATAYAHRNVVAIDRDPTARRYVRDVIATTPDDAILVAPWIYATPLAYVAYVERGLGTRIVVAAEPTTMTERIRAWSRARCTIVVSDHASPRLPGIELRSIGRSDAPYVFTVAPRSRPCASGVKRVIHR